MDLKELMSTTPESLAEIQLKELKNFTINRLKEITNLIEKEDFNKVTNEYLRFSPSGDGYGADNYFINFNYADTKEGIDISEILEQLDSLKNIKGRDKN